MTSLTILAALFGLTMSMTAPQNDFTSIPPDPAEVEQSLSAAKVSLGQAVASAEKAANGTAIDARAVLAGELRYGRSGRVTLTDTTPKGRLNKGEDRPLHRGLLLRLAEIRGRVGGEEVALACPPPDDFAATLKRLTRRH